MLRVSLINGAVDRLIQSDSFILYRLTEVQMYILDVGSYIPIT